MTHAIQATPAPPRTMRIGLDHVVMAGAVLCLVVLVVLPVGFLMWGSLNGESGLSVENFREALTGRLYVQALENSLILGAWTGLFSIVIGVPLAWAVARTNVPGKPLIRATATLAYLSPPFLTAIAFVNLFGPNAGLLTFPFVYLLAVSALHSVDASYEEAAQILGSSKWRTAFSITAPLVAPAILTGTLIAFVNAIALFGSQAIIGLPGRVVTLPTRIYALFDYPPEYGLASA